MYTQSNIDNSFKIHQGEACPIHFSFTDSQGNPITPSNENCTDISISIGKCEKRYSRNGGYNKEITFQSGEWIYWLTQADSYLLPVGYVPVQAYIKIDAGNIPVVDVEPIKVLPATNKVIL